MFFWSVVVGLMLPLTAAQAARLELSEWYLLGPFGHPDVPASGLPLAPNGLTEMRNYNQFFTAVQRSADLYPVNREVDLDATYKGPITVDAQGQEQALTWRKVTGGNVPAGNAMVVFMSTWVWVPADVAATLAARSYRGSRYSATEYILVNGSVLRNERADRANPPVTHPVNGQAVALKKGWNHIFTQHTVGWGTLQNHVALDIPDEVAGAKVSAEPPVEVGRRFTTAGVALAPAAPSAGDAGAAAEARVRTWTNRTGKQIRATYEALDGDSVVLRTEDGRVAKILLDRLSDEDRAYVRARSK